MKSVSIPNSVTAIGRQAFADCKSLASVSIPNSVTAIGVMAFTGCKSLVSVNIPDLLTTIEPSTFAGAGLISITIPNSVTTIGDVAFGGTGLISVTIPSSVTTIGGSAFYLCENLRTVTIGNSVTTIGSGAFSCSSLDTVICKANKPPVLDATVSPAFWTFCRVPKTIPVYVPCGSVAAYQTTAGGWNEFTNYQAIGGIPLPDMPDNVAVLQQNNVLEVSWRGTGASSYEIYRNNVLLTAIKTTTYTDTNNLSNGVNYCYKINAVHEPCVSGLSPEICKIFTKEVGIEQLQITNYELRVYPNPTSNQLRIENYELRMGNIEIYDIVGRNLTSSLRGTQYRSNPENNNEHAGLLHSVRNDVSEVRLDISHLSSGIYFLKIDGKTFKVVKQ
jgi:hypothetical protein